MEEKKFSFANILVTNGVLFYKIDIKNIRATEIVKNNSY